MFKKFILSSLILLPSFLQSENSKELPLELWSEVFSFCDFETNITCRYLNKALGHAANQAIHLEIKALKKNIKDHSAINDPECIKIPNFIAFKLRDLDALIKFENPPEKYRKYTSEDRFNRISSDRQWIIKEMQTFIHLLVDENCLSLPSNQRGISSDYVAESLDLKNYTLLYRQYVFRSLFPFARCAFRYLNDPTEGFKKDTYGEYASVIDPYFKIEFKLKKTFGKNNEFYLFECDGQEHRIEEELGLTVDKAFLPFIAIITDILDRAGADFVTNVLPKIEKDFLPKKTKTATQQNTAIIIQKFIRTAIAQKEFENLKKTEEERKLEKTKLKKQMLFIKRVCAASACAIALLGYLFYCGFLQSFFFSILQEKC